MLPSSCNGPCRYEKAEEKKAEAESDQDDASESPKQRWKASLTSGKCPACCFLFALILLIWGPLFMFSSSDVLGQRAPNLVEGVELDLQVRAQSGACLRPDPDGCTSDTYTLWSSSSATIKSANAYGMCGAYLDKPTKNLNCKTNDQGGWSPGSVAANLDDRFRCDSQNTHCVLCLSIT